VLIDYIQEKSEELRKKKTEFRSLNRELNKFYSKDLRDELNAKREEIKKIRAEVSEHLYENLQELLLIKRYFPELFSVLLEDDGIGDLVKKKDWLISRKEEKGEQAQIRLDEIRMWRAQLREAKKFVEKWPRPRIDARSIGATWPILKEIVEGEPEKRDVVEAIEKKGRALVREGWSVLLNSSLIGNQLGLFIEKIKKLVSEEKMKRNEFEKARGKGSVPEYEALRAYEKSRKERERMERVCSHLILANPAFLEKMKKELRLGKKNKTELERMIERTVVRKINETVWHKEMKKKLNVD